MAKTSGIFRAVNEQWAKVSDCGFVELEKNNGELSIIKMDGIELKK
jgi:hypothetical protein